MCESRPSAAAQFRARCNVRFLAARAAPPVWFRNDVMPAGRGLEAALRLPVARGCSLCYSPGANPQDTVALRQMCGPSMARLGPTYGYHSHPPTLFVIVARTPLRVAHHACARALPIARSNIAPDRNIPHDVCFAHSLPNGCNGQVNMVAPWGANDHPALGRGSLRACCTHHATMIVQTRALGRALLRAPERRALASLVIFVHRS